MTETTTLPSVPDELRRRIAAATTIFEALLPEIAQVAEEAKLARQEYLATLDALEAAGELHDSGRDAAGERDGVDRLGDALAALEHELSSIYTREGAA